MMYQRAGPGASDDRLGSFFGLALPLLKRAIPVEPVQIETAALQADFLSGYRLLLLTYEGQKPPDPGFHTALAAWVGAGGALVVVDDDRDTFHAVREWWNRSPLAFASPRQHLFLELGLPSDFRYYIERFIAKFAEHYRDSGIIQWPLLGITGDFGEAIFPVWHGNWPTQIPGLYHTHGGYWSADRYAQADFRAKMAAKFASIADLNAAWSTNFTSFAAIAMPELRTDAQEDFRVDEYTRAGQYPISTLAQRRRWLDYVDWYRASMTEYAQFWMQVTHKHLPDCPVMLCTGGDAIPSHGSEFAAQCKIAAPYGGVRITNEASVYAANFMLTNWVASAGSFYRGLFSFEPAGQVTEKGIVCRIYNATATGATELHFYEGNVTDTEDKAGLLVATLPNLYRSSPVKEVGAIYPDVSIVTHNVEMDGVARSFELLRDYTDFRFLDDLTISDGILSEVKVVILCGGELHRKATLQALRRWVEQGGILIGYNVNGIRTVEGDEDYMSSLFNPQGGERSVGTGASLFIPIAVSAETPSSIRQAALFDKIGAFLKKHHYHVSDGAIDGIYTAQLSDRLLVLNTHLEARTKSITLPDGATRILALPPNSITAAAL